MIDKRNQAEEIPLPFAVLLLGLLIAGLTIGIDARIWESYALRFDRYLLENFFFAAFSLIAFLVNAFAATVSMQKWLSYRRQGRRLRELTGEGRKDYERLITRGAVITALTLCIWAVMRCFSNSMLQNGPILSPLMLDLLCLNFATAMAVVLHWLWLLWKWMNSVRYARSALEEPPVQANRLILGTTFREVAHDKK